MSARQNLNNNNHLPDPVECRPRPTLNIQLDYLTSPGTDQSQLQGAFEVSICGPQVVAISAVAAVSWPRRREDKQGPELHNLNNRKIRYDYDADVVAVQMCSRWCQHSDDHGRRKLLVKCTSFLVFNAIIFLSDDIPLRMKTLPTSDHTEIIDFILRARELCDTQTRCRARQTLRYSYQHGRYEFSGSLSS